MGSSPKASNITDKAMESKGIVIVMKLQSCVQVSSSLFGLSVGDEVMS